MLIQAALEEAGMPEADQLARSWQGERGKKSDQRHADCVEA